MLPEVIVRDTERSARPPNGAPIDDITQMLQHKEDASG
jgi:hypothetical protein